MPSSTPSVLRVYKGSALDTLLPMEDSSDDPSDGTVFILQQEAGTEVHTPSRPPLAMVMDACQDISLATD